MCHCNPNIPTVRCRNCPDTKEVKSKSLAKLTVDIIPNENQIKIIEIIHGMLGNECYHFDYCSREQLRERMDNITDKLEEVSQLLMGDKYIKY